MLRTLAAGLLSRNVSRRLARVIPNPILRTVAVVAAGYAVDRLVHSRALRGAPRAPKLPGQSWGRAVTPAAVTPTA